VRPPHCLPLALAGQFGAFLLSVPVALAFIDPKTKELRQSPAATAAMFLPIWIALAVTVYVVSKRRSEHPLGLRPRFRSVDIGWLFAGVAAQFAIGIVYTLLPIDTSEMSKPAEDIIDRANGNSVGLVLLGLAVGVGAPIMEELFYRGVIHRGLRLYFAEYPRYVNVIAPFVLSSAIFATIHFQLLQFGALFAVGALCAFAFHKTNRIASAIAVHAGFNLTTVIALSAAVLSKDRQLLP
jgi:uncharacterized protein